MVNRLAFLLLAFSSALAAGESALTAADRELLDRAATALENPEQATDPEIARNSEAAVRSATERFGAEYEALRDRANVITTDAAAEHAPEAAGAEASTLSTPDGVTFRLFVSQSMPDGSFRSALDLARADPRVTVVLRGVRDGERLIDLVRRIHGDRKDPAEPVLAAVIDPPRFADDAVGVTPTLIAYDAAGTAIARVEGQLNVRALAARLAAGERGDLGRQGAVYPIAERDLMAAMQARAAAYDWEGARTRAVDRHFAQRGYVVLPHATTDRVRRVDPSVELAETVKTPEGRVLGFAGQRINPLEHMAFTQRLVVFDPRDADQVELAKRLARETKGRVTLIATRLVETGAWDYLAALQRDLERPLKLLTPELRDRLQLERVPCMVEAEGTELVIHEFAASQI